MIGDKHYSVVSRLVSGCNYIGLFSTTKIIEQEYLRAGGEVTDASREAGVPGQVERLEGREARQDRPDVCEVALHMGARQVQLQHRFAERVALDMAPAVEALRR